MAHHAPRRPSPQPGIPGRATAAPRFRWYRYTLAALTTTAVLLSGGVAVAWADPRVADIESRIDKDWNRLEAVIEQHNATRQDLAGRRREAEALDARIMPLQRQVGRGPGPGRQARRRGVKGDQVRAVNMLLGARSPGEVVEHTACSTATPASSRRTSGTRVDLRDELAAAKGQVGQHHRPAHPHRG